MEVRCAIKMHWKYKLNTSVYMPEIRKKMIIQTQDGEVINDGHN